MQQKPLAIYIKVRELRNAFFQDESGQDLIEYALVASLIALAATAGMTSVATAIGTAFTGVSNKLAAYTT